MGLEKISEDSAWLSMRQILSHENDASGLCGRTGCPGHLLRIPAGRLRLPTLIVQEGGYRTRTLGTNARRFFAGFLAGGA